MLRAQLASRALYRLHSENKYPILKEVKPKLEDIVRISLLLLWNSLYRFEAYRLKRCNGMAILSPRISSSHRGRPPRYKVGQSDSGTHQLQWDL